MDSGFQQIRALGVIASVFCEAISEFQDRDCFVALNVGAEDFGTRLTPSVTRLFGRSTLLAMTRLNFEFRI